VNFKGSFTHIRKIKFLLTKWAFCFPLTTSHIQPSFYIQGYLTTWYENGSWLTFSQAKSTFSNIWFPTATTFNAGNCSTFILDFNCGDLYFRCYQKDFNHKDFLYQDKQRGAIVLPINWQS
jgi:hypothetical protein